MDCNIRVIFEASEFESTSRGLREIMTITRMASSCLQSVPVLRVTIAALLRLRLSKILGPSESPHLPGMTRTMTRTSPVRVIEPPPNRDDVAADSD